MAPMMRPGVMTAKVHWNMAQRGSVMVPTRLSPVTPARNALERLPMKGFSPVKAREYPQPNHMRDMTQVKSMQAVKMLRTFLFPTSPP